MHIRDERVYQFCDALYPHILQCDMYVGEMDLEPTGGHMAGPVYAIKDYFRPAVYAKTRRQLIKSFSLDIDRYAHLHPLMIMSAISHSILENDHAVSLDEHLWNFAKASQLNVKGLESVHEQLSLLHSIDPGPLYVQIRNIGSRPEMIRKFTDRALAYYMKGEIHQLYGLTKSSMHALRKRIIYERNRLMVHRINSFDTDLRYFISVGAGHLSGESGLITMLRKKGWKITPVMS
jgi:uncharacterized protein